MSATWMLVRGASANPSSLKFAALMNKQSIAENEIFTPEKKQPSIISTHTEDLVVIQDPFFFTKLKPKTIHYRGGFEPDGNHLRLWCKFDHLALNLKDRAMSINGEDDFLPALVFHPHGSPKLCEGPDFDGIKGGSIVTKLNSNPDILDYYSILNPESMSFGIQPSFDNSHVGISMFFRFMLEGEPVLHNGVDPTLWHHVDDVNGDFGSIVRIGTNRELKFFIKNLGSSFNFISANNAVVPNVWTTACLTYKFSNNAMTMTINNVPQTDSASETPTFDGINNSVYVGIESSEFPDAGRFVGRLDDIRWYDDLVFWRDHETSIWNNGRSICAVPVLSFDGTDDYISLTNDATLWSQSLTKFSFSYWVYPTGMSDGINFLGIVDHLVNTNGGFGVFINTANSLQWVIRNGAGVSATASTAGFNSHLNKWVFVAHTYDNSLGSANLKTFVNGVQTATANMTDAINLSAILTLAQNGTDFKGYMKDFRWWTTIPLTEAQVNAVRQNRSNAPLPNYWLKMSEGNGNPVDFITRTKVGTLTNGTLWTIGSSPRSTEYGSLAVAGYSRFNDTVDVGGFDSTGFDSTGFDTT